MTFDSDRTAAFYRAMGLDHITFELTSLNYRQAFLSLMSIMPRDVCLKEVPLVCHGKSS